MGFNSNSNNATSARESKAFRAFEQMCKIQRARSIKEKAIFKNDYKNTEAQFFTELSKDITEHLNKTNCITPADIFNITDGIVIKMLDNDFNDKIYETKTHADYSYPTYTIIEANHCTKDDRQNIHAYHGCLKECIFQTYKMIDFCNDKISQNPKLTQKNLCETHFTSNHKEPSYYTTNAKDVKAIFYLLAKHDLHEYEKIPELKNFKDLKKAEVFNRKADLLFYHFGCLDNSNKNLEKKKEFSGAVEFLCNNTNIAEETNPEKRNDLVTKALKMEIGTSYYDAFEKELGRYLSRIYESKELRDKGIKANLSFASQEPWGRQ